MKRKVLRPHIIFRMALILFMLVILLTAIVSGLYARYTAKNDNDSPTASAAVWGFDVSVDGSKMFSEHYQGGVNATVGLGDSSYDVRAQMGGTVIAPDTSGYMTFSVKGMAEVDARVILRATGGDVTVTVNNGGGSSTVYRPILWSLAIIDGETTEYVVNDGSLEEVLALMESLNPIIEAGNTVDVEYRIEWEWPLETSEENNILDTVIAEYLAGKTIDSKYTVSARLEFDFVAAIEQVD